MEEVSCTILDLSSDTRESIQSDMVECDICIESKDEFIKMPCKHKCCIDCYARINKCHMCRGCIFEVMKADLKIRLKYKYASKANIVIIPFYYTEGVNLFEDTFAAGYTKNIDHMLLNKTYDILQTVIETYGFDIDIQSYELDNHRYDHDMTIRCQSTFSELTFRSLKINSQHNISKDNDEIADKCIDYEYIDKYCVNRKLSDDYIERRQDYLMKICLMLRSKCFNKI